eukprot:TRINITY_DN7899_c0_g1_i4.p1 TRINITY_DN7899_c0_g1~~TRINITY_DN7899_c0_g1_i4.p1  ORF type:complete len:209 (+),score=30.37 TRINITY_DN7899_c0_g1_i4:104-730(+)
MFPSRIFRSFTSLKSNAQRRSIFPSFSSSLISISSFFGLYYFVTEELADCVWVEGGSMRPSLNPDSSFQGGKKMDYCLIRKWNYVPKVGDVVCLWSPIHYNKSIIKRIVAMEGDVILDRRREKSWKIPTGHCWIEGDNAGNSIDSNFFGPVSIYLIQGKALRVLIPQNSSQRERFFRKIENVSDRDRVFRVSQVENGKSVIRFNFGED